MKALIHRRFGPPDVLEWCDDWPMPVTPPDGVLIEVIAAGVNPKDALLRKGMFSRTLARKPLPRALGLDVAGTIAEVGDQVTDVQVGDTVFGMTNAFAGGVHAEFAALHRSEIDPAPATLSAAESASIPLAAQTALQALRDCAELQAGQCVLINGASGGVGHFALQIAKALGADVWAVCSSKNTDFATASGADQVVPYDKTSVTELEQDFDVVFDVFGKRSRKHFARQLRARQGIYVSTVPKPSTMAGEFLARTGLFKRSRLVQVRSKAADLRLIANWVHQGQLRPHIGQVFPIEQAAKAHQQIETKRTVGKIVLSLRPST